MHCFLKFLERTKTVISFEDGVVTGGFGSAVVEFAAGQGFKGKLVMMGVPDRFIDQGSVSQLQEISGISVAAIVAELKKCISDQ